jgi:branched-chain amino acid transport system permease protein
MPFSHEISYWIQQLLNAITLASFYVPLAMAYALVQGITNKIFLSFGDFAMYATFATIYTAVSMAQNDFDPWLIAFLSLAVGMVCAAALGHLSASQIFIPLRNRSSQAFMIGSIGVSIMLQEAMRIQSSNRDVWLFPLFDNQSIPLIGGSFPVQVGLIQVLSIVVSIITIIFVLVVMKFTKFGLYWYACAQNEVLAKLTGLNTDQVLRWACVASATLASVSGWIIVTTSGGVNFSIGIMLGFKALFATLIGGFGTIAGAVKGGVFLAFAETLWTSVFPTDYRDVAVFGVIIVILVLKPDGLHSSYQRRESET